MASLRDPQVPHEMSIKSKGQAFLFETPERPRIAPDPEAAQEGKTLRTAVKHEKFIDFRVGNTAAKTRVGAH